MLVVDEFDSVLDAETRTRLADTIKLLSARGSKLSFMVVGVSDTWEQLLQVGGPAEGLPQDG